MLAVKNLQKSFGPILAVRGVSFGAETGEVLGFLGPNGAGKTTTMRMITGFLPATAGTAVINGFDIAEKPREAKKQIGYLPENAPVYGEMTVWNYLAFIAEIRGFCGANVSPGNPMFARRKQSARAKPRIGVCPGAEYGPAKRWPAERFAAAMREFHTKQPAEWILFGVAGDAPAGDAIAAGCDFEVTNRIGKTSLDELMDLGDSFSADKKIRLFAGYSGSLVR